MSRSQIYDGWTPKFPKPHTAEKREILHGMKYEKRRNEVFAQQEGKCGDCGKEFGSVTEMTLHHKRKRKMGGGSRDDRAANLIGVCWEPCHKNRESALQWSEPA